MTVLYRQIADRILAEIAAGQLKVGDRLPPESDYAAQLGISRSTLRLAFADLEAAGVLRRRKRVGTEIISAKPLPRTTLRDSNLIGLLGLGDETDTRVTGTRTVRSDEVRGLVGIDRTWLWLEVACTTPKPANGPAASTIWHYLPPQFAGVEQDLRTSESPVLKVIETANSVTLQNIRLSVLAVACPNSTARLIGLFPGDPVLLIQGQLFEQNGLLMDVVVAYANPSRLQAQLDLSVD